MKLARQKRQIHCDLAYKYVETSQKRKKSDSQSRTVASRAGGEGGLIGPSVQAFSFKANSELRCTAWQLQTLTLSYAGHSLREPIFSLQPAAEAHEITQIKAT